LYLYEYILQVSEGGPTNAHATLDVESYMVFFKTMGHSRKNIAEGVARMYGLTERAYFWGLTQRDLETNDKMRGEFTIKVTERNGKAELGDARHPPLAMILGLLVDEGVTQEIIGEYYAHVRHLKALTKKWSDTMAPRLDDYRPLIVPGGPASAPDGARRDQTAQERAYVLQCRRLTHYKSCVLRGTLFHTEGESKKRVSDNSGISFPQPMDDGSTGCAYGVITDILCHQLPGTEPRYAARLHWYDTGPKLYGELQVVEKQAAGSEDNRLFGCMWLRDAYAQNVVFWPKNLRKPRDKSMIAIYRGSRHRYHNV
jgi:hypothetical protein